jgi:hypothetical protein
MIQIQQYQLGEYREALHKHGATQYCVPEKLTINTLDPYTGKYKVKKTITGRQDCGYVIHKALMLLKDYQTQLKISKSVYYTQELSQHPIKRGHGVGNYTAQHMMDDVGFYPPNYWTVRKQNPDKWAQGSPIPKYMEPYWATEHALEKTHSWIKEYCHWIYNDPSYDDKLKLQIREHLDKALIELGTQTNTITHQPKVEEVAL